jgi:hypothetical protein
MTAEGAADIVHQTTDNNVAEAPVEPIAEKAVQETEPEQQQQVEEIKEVVEPKEDAYIAEAPAVSSKRDAPEADAEDLLCASGEKLEGSPAKKAKVEPVAGEDSATSAVDIKEDTKIEEKAEEVVAEVENVAGEVAEK